MPAAPVPPSVPLPAPPPVWGCRRATTDDATAIAALAIQVFLDTYATEGVRPDIAREALATYGPQAFAQRLAEPGRCFWLATCGTGLVGLAELSVGPPGQASTHCPAVLPRPGGRSGAELVRLYVQPRHQGRGWGRALLQAAEHEARRQGQPQLWLTAWDGNTRARAFYSVLGYADVGGTTYGFEGQTWGNRVFCRPLPALPRPLAPLLRLRPEQAADTAGLVVLTAQAFEGHPHSDGSEPRILQRLREAGALHSSWVACHEGRLVGHAALSPVQVGGKGGAEGWLGLGPVSVAPGHQGQGVGQAVVRVVLQQAQARGAAGCVVLGDAAWYARFGFAPQPGLVLPGVPAEHFTALAWRGEVPRGEVGYHEAFSAG